MSRARVFLAAPPVPGSRLAAGLLVRRDDRCRRPPAGSDGNATLTRYQSIPLAAPEQGGRRAARGPGNRKVSRRSPFVGEERRRRRRPCSAANPRDGRPLAHCDSRNRR